MIYTLTFNPSLDYILNVREFAQGVVNRSFKDKYLPGGKGINVSVVLSDCGAATKALGFVGGFVGDEIVRLLKEQGVATDFVYLDDAVSRINVKIKSDSETEVNAQGPEITDIHLEQLYQKLENITDGDTLVLAGSVPKGINDNIYVDIMKRISAKNVKIVVDAEGDLLMNTLPFKPFLIKPNNFELSQIFGKELTDVDEIIECADKLREQGARNVMVSLGGDGAVLVAADGCRYYSQAPDGKLINSTGAGDSSVAGFLYGYDRYNDYKKAFAYALCSGSACAFSENLPTKDEIEGIMQYQHIYDKINII